MNISTSTVKTAVVSFTVPSNLGAGQIVWDIASLPSGFNTSKMLWIYRLDKNSHYYYMNNNDLGVFFNIYNNKFFIQSGNSYDGYFNGGECKIMIFQLN